MGQGTVCFHIIPGPHVPLLCHYDYLFSRVVILCHLARVGVIRVASEVLPQADLGAGVSWPLGPLRSDRLDTVRHAHIFHYGPGFLTIWPFPAKLLGDAFSSPGGPCDFTSVTHNLTLMEDNVVLPLTGSVTRTGSCPPPLEVGGAFSLFAAPDAGHLVRPLEHVPSNS